MRDLVSSWNYSRDTSDIEDAIRTIIQVFWGRNEFNLRLSMKISGSWKENPRWTDDEVRQVAHSDAASLQVASEYYLETELQWGRAATINLWKQRDVCLLIVSVEGDFFPRCPTSDDLHYEHNWNIVDQILKIVEKAEFEYHDAGTSVAFFTADRNGIHCADPEHYQR